MPRRRLCAALLLTGRVADEVEGLRRALGSAEIDRIAPHITLAPPVNVPEPAVEHAIDLLRQAASTSEPVNVTLGPVSTFWPVAPVCYLAVSGDLTAIGALRDSLVEASGPLAAPPGRTEREFVPHVTVNQHIEADRIPAALEALAGYRAAATFARVTLLEFAESERRWAPLADAALAAPAVYGRGGLEVHVSAGSQLDPAARAWADRTWQQYSLEQYGPGTRPTEPFALVARISGEIVGIAEGELRTHVTRLASLIVAPGWRSTGVGSRLLAETERQALAHRSVRVRLETVAGGRAEGFYRGRGYEVVALLPRWREERDFVVLERALGA
jgi:2'-5' RNA ligase